MEPRRNFCEECGAKQTTETQRCYLCSAVLSGDGDHIEHIKHQLAKIEEQLDALVSHTRFLDPAWLI